MPAPAFPLFMGMQMMTTRGKSSEKKMNLLACIRGAFSTWDELIPMYKHGQTLLCGWHNGAEWCIIILWTVYARNCYGDSLIHCRRHILVKMNHKQPTDHGLFHWSAVLVRIAYLPIFLGAKTKYSILCSHRLWLVFLHHSKVIWRPSISKWMVVTSARTAENPYNIVSWFSHSKCPDGKLW